MATLTTTTVLPSSVTLKKSAAVKRSISSADLENVENQQHRPSSAKKKAGAAVPIISSHVMVKKAFATSPIVADGNVLPLTESTKSALNNKANIINNSQQPKAPRLANKVQAKPPAVTGSIIKPTTCNSEAFPATATKGKAILPMAVARRNARERNRVKQVNNGFAALRQHIPEEMAEAFELHKGSSSSAAAAAGSAAAAAAAQKKLSKVETLRMAVEYIRNLEGLLNISATPQNSTEHSFSFCDTSSLVSNSPSPSYSNSSMMDEEPHPPHSQLLAFTVDESSIDQSHIVLPSVTTINGIPYLRLPNQANGIGGSEFLDSASLNGSYVLVTANSDHSDFQSGDDEELIYQQQQPQEVAPLDPQSQQPIILYAPAMMESNFQSNFVNNNLLAPAFQQGGPTTTTAVEASTRAFNGGGDRGSGQSAAAVRSPVPDADQIKIDQQATRGLISGGGDVLTQHHHHHLSHNDQSSAAYVNKSALIRHIQYERNDMTIALDESPSPAVAAKRLPPLTNASDQFAVVDQSGVIVRGNFIEIKQEHPPQFNIDSAEEILTAESLYDNTMHERLLHLKAEMPDEETDHLSLLGTDITEEHMIDAMEWWENEKKSS